jgi:hypothetical protein
MADGNISADDFIDHKAMTDEDHPANEFIDKTGTVENWLKSTAPTATPGEAIREGFAQGGTYGFAPRIGAAMGAGLEMGAGADIGGFPLVPGAEPSEKKKLKDLYNEYLDYNNKLQEKAQKSHPGLYYGSMLAGGMASPLNKIASVGLGSGTAKAAAAAEKLAATNPAIQTASMPLKMTLGGLGGAKAGALGGLSQSKDLTDIPQDITQMGKGAMFGTGIGAAMPPVGSTLKAGAGLGSNLLESFFGPVPKTVGEGFRAGLEAAPNLAKATGQEAAQQGRKEFATSFVDNLRKIIKSNAKDKIQKIQSWSENIPNDQVDTVLNEILEMDPAKMGTKEAEEFSQIKEEILRAKEGPMRSETVRQYPGQAPAPVLASSSQQFRPPVNPAEVLPPQGAAPQPPMPGTDVTPPPPPQLGPGGQNLPMPQAPAIEGQAFRMAPPPEPTPSEFQGYEAVHKATIGAEDKEAREMFAQKLHEKLADEKALGKNFNDSPIQMEEHPIPGTDKVRLIAKRAVVGEDADAFKEQAQALTQQQKEQQRLQDLLDRQNEESAKMKQQQEAEMVKPQFQDVQQQVRSGGRNIYNPQELYQLQQLMQELGTGVTPRMSTKGMQSVAKGASQDLANVLKKNVGTGDVDQALHAFNNIGEVLGIDPRDLQLPGGVGEKVREDALNKVFKIINPENFSDSDLVNQEKIQYIAKQLESINPDLSNKFVESVQKQAETKGLIKEFTKPYEPTGINPALNVIRRNMSKLAYNAAYNVGEQVQKVGADIGPAIQAGQKIFSRYTPDSLQQAASRALASGDQTVQQFGQVLSKLATADERTRNSMIFVLEQQAGYKAMLNKLLEPEKEKTPQAKDKTLQKYK